MDMDQNVVLFCFQKYVVHCCLMLVVPRKLWRERVILEDILE